MRQTEMLGPYRYRQSDTCFPLGQDTLLLAEFTRLKVGARVCDLGCGAGALPLLLLGREPTIQVAGVEISHADAELCRQNLVENGLFGEISTGDLRYIRTLLPAGRFDCVVSNPPYFSLRSGASGGAARSEETCNLNDLCAAAGWLLQNGGRFTLTYRPERLCDLLESLRRHGLEPKRLQFVQHRQEAPPAGLLLEAVRQGKAGLTVLPGRILT